MCAQRAHVSKGEVPNPPDSGKDIAKSKGVLGNWESPIEMRASLPIPERDTGG